MKYVGDVSLDALFAVEDDDEGELFAQAEHERDIMMERVWFGLPNENLDVDIEYYDNYCGDDLCFPTESEMFVSEEIRTADYSW